MKGVQEMIKTRPGIVVFHATNMHNGNIDNRQTISMENRRGSIMKQWVLRGIALLGIAATIAGSPAYVQASGSYALTDSDFFNVQHTDISAVTQSDPHLFLFFYNNNSSISFDDRRYSQYNAVTFYVGADRADTVDAASYVHVLGDGHLIKSIPLTSPSPSPLITVRIAGHHIITFQRVSDNDIGHFYMGAPTLVHLGPTPPAAPTIMLASGSVKGGDQQTVDVATQANRLVTILIVYANGRHIVVGPQRSGPTGHDIYTFNVPNGVAGVAQIVAIVNGSGVAQTQFTVF